MSQKNKNSAFMHPVNISSDLAVIVGKGPMPRTEIVKKVWEYIKKHNCQDQKNKRNILPDANLAKVFGSSDPIDMFQMTKALSQHIIK
ncbi:DNA topoisomerase I/SWI domain fusion protein,SWIB/MDM2 domain [Chlamydia serpentis]|uniref:DNA topoisomerase I/SWI domain fusion protein,SWIB/MDM2 domain n=1 Tax=Chlamydia serpentis TaxID=1967782 RepID=A0A2R8FBL7_9CHLA|nr:SWIB/MDM2 domain-containing protein [Chlamydia serpentis]SPN73696.1 DNA topoisomerase I/SWI domain fusion protein,SWIB/MDM2 domain [Chlamydia serpentis]